MAVTKRIHKRKIGSVDIYFLSAESIAVAQERKSIYGDLSSYILLQSWHERNKAPFRRFRRQLLQRNDLTFTDIQLLAGRYNVQVTTVSREIVPAQFRNQPASIIEQLVTPEVAHAGI